MRFYRLEKPNYFKDWIYQIFKSLGISLLITIALMLVCGYKFMIVSSGSMEPTLPVGTMVIVTPCEYEDLEYNDIVTMSANGIHLTHRIVGRYDETKTKAYLKPGDEGYATSTQWVTKGDNSDTVDGPINDKIVGVVKEAHCFTFVGELVRYVKANYPVIIIFAIILVVFVEVLNYLKGKLQSDDIECYETDEDEE